jgi:hypothetical protein
MAREIRPRGGRKVAAVALTVVVGAAVAFAQAPPAASPAQASALVAALQAKGLDAFAVRDPERPGRFLAVLHIADVQLLLVSAAYSKPSDIEYRLEHREFNLAYADLNNSMLSSDRFFVEDAHGDGLVARPKKGVLADTVTVGTEQRVFDGDFVGDNKKNPKKITEGEYYKAFTSADERYARLLGLLIDELKKSGE